MKRFDLLLQRYGTMMNRLATWRAAASTAKFLGCRRFIETGCYRGTESDGCSTILLAALARALGGKLDSYEIDSKNIQIARQELSKLGLQHIVTFHVGDSVARLAQRTEPVDFAYLDSYDCGPGPDFGPCQNHQLAECEAILPLMNNKAAILLDDNLPETGGKTKLTVKRLTARGWKNLASGYQVLLSSDNTKILPHSRFAVLCGHLESFLPVAVETIYANKAQYALRHGYDLRVVRSCGKYADPKTHANGFSWARLDEMWRLVESGHYEWVWCIGGDTLITNFTITLDSLTALSETPEAELLPLPECPPYPNSPAPCGIIKWEKTHGHKDYGRKHLIISAERVTPMQADSFLVRGSPEGAAYLRDLLDHYPTYRYHPWVENQAMIDLRYKHAAITYMIPQWRLNCVDFSRWYKNGAAYRDGTDCFGNRGQWIKGDFVMHWPASTLQERLDWMEIYKQKIIY